MMDINCVHQCYYQADGKCLMNELPASTPVGMSAGIISPSRTVQPGIDCPYFTQPTQQYRQ